MPDRLKVGTAGVEAEPRSTVTLLSTKEGFRSLLRSASKTSATTVANRLFTRRERLSSDNSAGREGTLLKYLLIFDREANDAIASRQLLGLGKVSEAPSTRDALDSPERLTDYVETTGLLTT